MEDEGTFQDVSFVPGLLNYHQQLPGCMGHATGRYSSRSHTESALIYPELVVYVDDPSEFFTSRLTV